MNPIKNVIIINERLATKGGEGTRSPRSGTGLKRDGTAPFATLMGRPMGHGSTIKYQRHFPIHGKGLDSKYNFSNSKKNKVQIFKSMN